MTFDMPWKRDNYRETKFFTFIVSNLATENNKKIHENTSKYLHIRLNIIKPRLN